MNFLLSVWAEKGMCVFAFRKRIIVFLSTQTLLGLA